MSIDDKIQSMRQKLAKKDAEQAKNSSEFEAAFKKGMKAQGSLSSFMAGMGSDQKAAATRKWASTEPKQAGTEKSEGTTFKVFVLAGAATNEAGAHLTKDQAIKMMNGLKKQGRTAWVADASGTHVPVAGAMKPIK